MTDKKYAKIESLFFLTAALLFGFTSTAMATGIDSAYEHGAMMGDWGWAAMIIGPIMMIAVLAAIIIVVVLILRWFGGGPQSAQIAARRPGDDALDILRERFSRGEIDAQEFNEKRRILEQ